jgi:hypothetical protein
MSSPATANPQCNFSCKNIERIGPRLDISGFLSFIAALIIGLGLPLVVVHWAIAPNRYRI